MDESASSPPAKANYSPSLWFWISAGTVMLTFLIGLILLAFVVPVFVEMFADFGAKLPISTQMVINLSEFVKSYFLLLPLPLMGLAAMTTWGLYELDKRKHVFAVIVIGNIPPLIVIIMLIAMFLPMAQLIRTLAE